MVKALYDYEAAQAGELSVTEDEILEVFSKEEDWLLVQSRKEGQAVGYVPGNYVEEVNTSVHSLHIEVHRLTDHGRRSL